MKTYLYKLKFISPIHLSSDPLSLGKAEAILHSDTLFSAIANSFSLLFDMDNSFFENPPFVLSSGFPFYKDILFLPKPLAKLNIPPEQYEPFRKNIKKAKFISIGIFNKFLNGETINVSEKNFSGNDFISEEEVKEVVYTSEERPRSSVPRAGGETTIFYSNSIKFGQNCGLYFLASFENEEAKKKFDSALYLLGDIGIGGERSAGYGRFTFGVEEPPKLGNDNGEYFISLSLYYPTKEEIENNILNNAHYSVVTRQNWVYSGSARPLRSKSVRMFTEGSVFKNSIEAKGSIVDVTPEIAEKNQLGHRIMRYGKLFKALIPEKAILQGGKNG